LQYKVRGDHEKGLLQLIAGSKIRIVAGIE
jgi:hypothetical protein